MFGSSRSIHRQKECPAQCSASMDDIIMLLFFSSSAFEINGQVRPSCKHMFFPQFEFVMLIKINNVKPQLENSNITTLSNDEIKTFQSFVFAHSTFLVRFQSVSLKLFVFFSSCHIHSYCEPFTSNNICCVLLSFYRCCFHFLPVRKEFTVESTVVDKHTKIYVCKFCVSFVAKVKKFVALFNCVYGWMWFSVRPVKWHMNQYMCIILHIKFQSHYQKRTDTDRPMTRYVCAGCCVADSFFSPLLFSSFP